jgi:putative hydrolase of the HAD superfamily
MQLKAIILDYGGVLGFFPTEEQFRELAAACRLTLEQFLDGYWSQRAAYDRGDLGTVEYWQEIGRRGGQSYTSAEITAFSRRDALSWVHLDQRMLAWAGRLRAAGFRTGLLSNLPEPLGRYFRDEMRLPELFDHHSFSYELRAAKPEAAIYRHAIEGLGVQPGEALFIDDRPENVAGAEACGIRSIQFESPRRLREQLDQLARGSNGFVPFGTPPIFLE